MTASDAAGAGLERAVAHHRAGRLAAAERGYRAVLERDRGNFDARHMLGVVCLQRGDAAAAAGHIEAAIAAAGGSAEAHFNLSRAHEALGRPDAALDDLERALAMRGRYPEAHLNRGQLLRRGGRLEDAARSFEAALEARPGYPEALDALAALRESTGDFVQALEGWRAMLRADPRHAGAWYRIARHDPALVGDADAGAMRALLGDDATAPQARIELHFALAAVEDRHGRHARAFAHLRAGNALRRSLAPFDVERDAAGYTRIMAVFDAAFVAQPRTACESPLPVFVVGMPRSGTSLVEQMLASHPAVHGGGEREWAGEIAQRDGAAGAAGFPGWVAAPGDVDWRALGERYVSRLRALDPAALRITDKMPHNLPLAGFIHAMLPRATIVHVAREPVDTGFACYRQLFAHGHEFSYDLADTARMVGLYRDLAAHWRRTIGERFVEVRYEALVADPRAALEPVLTRCGLDWDDACLAFHHNTRPVRTASAAEVRRPLYRHAVGRWRPYARWLGPLLDAFGGGGGEPGG